MTYVKARETISYKTWNLTAEDWRNRAKWDDYADAVHEIVERTGTTAARWTPVEGNNKKYPASRSCARYARR